MEKLREKEVCEIEEWVVCDLTSYVLPEGFPASMEKWGRKIQETTITNGHSKSMMRLNNTFRIGYRWAPHRNRL